MKKIPVTILTGFLGAGKSTLISKILTTHPKSAIILNEFSNSIEIESIITNSTENVLEFANGCMCCTIKDPSILKIERFLEGKEFDRVLIELSGLADPGKIAQMFWLDDELESSLFLDSVVCLVDGLNFVKSLEVCEWQRQVALADLVLITKEQSQTCLEQVKSVNPFAQILTEFKPELILDQKLFTRKEIPKFVHSNRFSVCLDHCSVTSIEAIERILMTVCWENKFLEEDVSVWRMKGIISDGKRSKLIQAVYDTFESTEISPVNFTKIVLIGDKLPFHPNKLFY